MYNSKDYINDERIDRILVMIQKYSLGEFDFQEPISKNNDKIDAVISGLNALASKKVLHTQQSNLYQKRVEKILDVFIKYTLLDFSQKAEVTDYEDEIDAIAICLNALSEELQTTISAAQIRLDDLEEANGKIEAILENAPSGIVIIDEMRNISRWNKKSESIFGWQTEEVVGRPVREIITLASILDSQQIDLKDVILNNDDVFSKENYELSATRKDKTKLPIELNISSVKSQGKYIYILFITDILKRKHSEEIIKKINQNMAGSVKSLESFTYSVSHDLRAPLRAIHGYMSILKNEYLKIIDEKGQEMMMSVISNSKKMGQLIDDLLALSRLDRIEFQMKEVNMNELVKSVIDDSDTIFNHKKAKIIVHLIPNVFGDINLLRQVYINLISNALKYSSLKDEPIIEIGCTYEAGKNSYYIKDNGSGFDMKFYNKLFGVFQRLHDSREFEGNGIGLSIVKQIITKHGGDVWATSEIDKGATFYFSIETNKTVTYDLY